MNGLNKVMLIGHLGKAPELQTLENGVVLAKFSLATNESYKDAQGNLHTETEWHTVLLWKNLAEKAVKLLQKGNLVYLEGKLKTRNYTDKNGMKHYITEVVADSFLVLDKK